MLGVELRSPLPPGERHRLTPEACAHQSELPGCQGQCLYLHPGLTSTQKPSAGQTGSADCLPVLGQKHGANTTHATQTEMSHMRQPTTISAFGDPSKTRPDHIMLLFL